MGSTAKAATGRRSRWLGAVALFLSTMPILTGTAPQAAATAGAAKVVVRFIPGTPDEAGELAAAGAVGYRGAATADHFHADRYVIAARAADAPDIVARLRREPGVAYAGVAQSRHATASVPNDPCYSGSCAAEFFDKYGNVYQTTASQGYLQTVDAPAAWSISTGAGVRVAVLDTGADAQHPDLAGKVASQQNLCSCGDMATTDDNGHGTHVSGILAADTDNGTGVASVGWDVKVDEYKILDASGAGDTAATASAVNQAVAQGDRVISMSLSSGVGYNCSSFGSDPDEEAAIENAIAHNVVIVAAAGNESCPTPEYPASYPGVLAVAATDDSGSVESFSEYGPAANIAAPGYRIVSTWFDGKYALDTGTSMATPMVAAAAALVIAHRPSLSAPQVAEILTSSARPTTGGHPINGGLLDVRAALLAADAAPPTHYDGYAQAGRDGHVYSFGGVGQFGDVYGAPLARPVVGDAVRTDGLGYWMVASDGGVFSFGASQFFGSQGGKPLFRPVVGMAATADSGGYWLVASDGGVFSFGDGHFLGSEGGQPLFRPVVGIAGTPTGNGYWLVASDGGVFTFGDAHFAGSTGGQNLAAPVVGVVPTASGQGYWLVASDGGVFTFGDATFFGSAFGRTSAPVVGMAPTADFKGYWLVASDGGTFALGDARYHGSAFGQATAPIAGAAS